MIGAVKIQVRPEEIIEAVKGMEKRKREAFLEDLIAATSPEYLSSIREARADYKMKRVKTHEEVFGKWNELCNLAKPEHLLTQYPISSITQQTQATQQAQ